MIFCKLIVLSSLESVLTVLGMPTNGAGGRGGAEGVAKRHLSAKTCHAYSIMMNLCSVILESLKNIQITWNLWSSGEMTSAFGEIWGFLVFGCKDKNS